LHYGLGRIFEDGKEEARFLFLWFLALKKKVVLRLLHGIISWRKTKKLGIL